MSVKPIVFPLSIGAAVLLASLAYIAYRSVPPYGGLATIISGITLPILLLVLLVIAHHNRPDLFVALQRGGRARRTASTVLLVCGAIGLPVVALDLLLRTSELQTLVVVPLELQFQNAAIACQKPIRGLDKDLQNYPDAPQASLWQPIEKSAFQQGLISTISSAAAASGLIPHTFPSASLTSLSKPAVEAFLRDVRRNDTKFDLLLAGIARDETQYTLAVFDVPSGNKKWEQDIHSQLSLLDLRSRLQAFLGGPDAPSGLKRPPTHSSEAYLFYVRGRYYWNERSLRSLETSLKFFEEAINFDSTFALAYVGKADAYNMLLGWRFQSPQEMYENANRALLKAEQATSRDGGAT